MNFFAGLLLLLMPEENAFWYVRQTCQVDKVVFILFHVLHVSKVQENYGYNLPIKLLMVPEYFLSTFFCFLKNWDGNSRSMFSYNSCLIQDFGGHHR